MTNSNLRTREFETRDLEAVARVEAVSFPLPLSKLALVFLSETCLFYVATARGEVVGHMILGYEDREILHCFRIAVDPMHKRRGIASRLLRKGIEENPCQRYTTEIRKNNLEARRFWESQGFREMFSTRILNTRKEYVILAREPRKTTNRNRTDL